MSFGRPVIHLTLWFPVFFGLSCAGILEVDTASNKSGNVVAATLTPIGTSAHRYLPGACDFIIVFNWNYTDEEKNQVMEIFKKNLKRISKNENSWTVFLEDRSKSPETQKTLLDRKEVVRLEHCFGFFDNN